MREDNRFEADIQRILDRLLMNTDISVPITDRVPPESFRKMGFGKDEVGTARIMQEARLEDYVLGKTSRDVCGFSNYEMDLVKGASNRAISNADLIDFGMSRLEDMIYVSDTRFYDSIWSDVLVKMRMAEIAMGYFHNMITINVNDILNSISPVANKLGKLAKTDSAQRAHINRFMPKREYLDRGAIDTSEYDMGPIKNFVWALSKETDDGRVRFAVTMQGELLTGVNARMKIYESLKDITKHYYKYIEDDVEEVLEAARGWEMSIAKSKHGSRW